MLSLANRIELKGLCKEYYGEDEAEYMYCIFSGYADKYPLVESFITELLHSGQKASTLIELEHLLDTVDGNIEEAI